MQFTAICTNTGTIIEGFDGELRRTFSDEESSLVKRSPHYYAHHYNQGYHHGFKQGFHYVHYG